MKRPSKRLQILLAVALLLYACGYVTQFIGNYAVWQKNGGMLGGTSPPFPSLTPLACLKGILWFPYSLYCMAGCAAAVAAIVLYRKLFSQDALTDSEGCVWLCNAALTFDPARGSFASYARRVVQNGLVGYCRNVLSKYQRTVSLGDLEPAVLTALEVQNAISSHTKCETSLLLVAAESQYSGVTRKGIHALALQVSGIPLTAVSVRMSVPPNHVSAWISRAVRKLRNNESFLSSLHEN